jgi:hypothetical protein
VDGPNHKVQLIPVAGSNGLYTLSPFLPPVGGLENGQNHVQLPADFLHAFNASDLINADAAQLEQLAGSVGTSAGDFQAAAVAALQQPPRKRQKKIKVLETGDEDEVAEELLKLFQAPDSDAFNAESSQQKKSTSKKPRKSLSKKD